MEKPKNGEGLDAPTELTLVEEARLVVAELKAANEEKKALLDREERMHTNDLLRGRGEAGTGTPKPKEETPVEYKDRIMRGGV